MGDHEAMSGNTGLSGSDSFALPAGATGSYTRAIERARYLLDRAPGLAEEQAREILAVVPASGEAHLVRGLALAGCRLDEAVTALRNPSAAAPTTMRHGALWANSSSCSATGGADFAFAQQLRCQAKDPQLQAAAVAIRCATMSPSPNACSSNSSSNIPPTSPPCACWPKSRSRIRRYRDAIYLLEHALELAPASTPRVSISPPRSTASAKMPRRSNNSTCCSPSGRAASSYRNLAAAALGRIGDLDAAIAHYEYLVERHPAASKIWMSYGHSLKTVGRQADAVDAYRRASRSSRAMAKHGGALPTSRRSIWARRTSPR
jgi:tetratricopeptide (TPR) repeat protein